MTEVDLPKLRYLSPNQQASSLGSSSLHKSYLLSFNPRLLDDEREHARQHSCRGCDCVPACSISSSCDLLVKACLLVLHFWLHLVWLVIFGLQLPFLVGGLAELRNVTN
ncbi:hypothetical protein NMG60_11034411 [Bertholletia excelsa]